MKISKLAASCLGFFGGVVIALMNPMVCSAAPEGYTEYKVQGHSISFPDDWYVMYEGKEDLEEIYTMYQLDSYESFQERLDGAILEAVNVADADLNSQTGALESENGMDLFMLEDTEKFPLDYKELKEQPEDVRQSFLEAYANQMKSESGMSLGDTYLAEGTNADFAVITLSYLDYHYIVAGTVSGGRVFTFMTLSRNGEEVIAEKEKIVGEILQSYCLEETAANADGGEKAEDTAVIEESPENITIEKEVIEISLGIFIILLFVLLLIGVKGKKKQEFHEDAFSLSVMKGLQGFCAVGIILHHLAQAITQNNNLDKGTLNLMCDIGVFFVGVFFFCSGYGVYTSLKTKPDYLKGFLSKRLSTILVPFYTGNTIFVLTAILFGETFTKAELISALTGWVLLNTQLWFIVEIFILYIAFYILFKILKNEKTAFIFMGVFIIAFMAASLFLGHDFQTKSGGAWLKGEWWYNSILLFYIGMIFSRYYNALLANMKKNYLVWMSAGLIGSGVFYALTEYMLKTKGYWAEWDGHPGYLEKIQTLSCQLPMIIFMVITFFLITMKFQFKNDLLAFLGKIAIELYIIHNLFIIYLRDQIEIKNDFIYIISVYILAISMAVLLHAFDQRVIALIKGKNPGGGGGEGIEEQKDTKLDSQREYFIDCMRLLMTFFVVFIHSPFGGKAGEIFFCFGKMAVPFFIVVSGYFCFSDKTEIFKQRIKKQAKRIFMFCVGANFLYVYLYLIGNKLGLIPVGIQKQVNDSSIVDLFLYNQSPVADHLWFLGSLFYALILMLVLIKIKFHKHILFLAPVLLCIYLYLAYNGGGDFIRYRNVLIVTLPYFMMGCLIHRYKQKIQEIVKPGILISTAAVFVVCVAGEYLIRKNTGVPYLSIEVLVYLVVLVCLYYPNIGSKGIVWWLGSRCTLPVYIWHMGVLWVLWFAYTSFAKTYPTAVTVIAFALPLLLSAFIGKIKQHSHVKLL